MRGREARGLRWWAKRGSEVYNDRRIGPRSDWFATLIWVLKLKPLIVRSFCRNLGQIIRFFQPWFCQKSCLPKSDSKEYLPCAPTVWGSPKLDPWWQSVPEHSLWPSPIVCPGWMLWPRMWWICSSPKSYCRFPAAFRMASECERMGGRSLWCEQQVSVE